jgi:hypothetical protein
MMGVTRRFSSRIHITPRRGVASRSYPGSSAHPYPHSEPCFVYIVLSLVLSPFRFSASRFGAMLVLGTYQFEFILLMYVIHTVIRQLLYDCYVLQNPDPYGKRHDDMHLDALDCMISICPLLRYRKFP